MPNDDLQLVFAAAERAKTSQDYECQAAMME
jgi:hypothetical protein